MSKLMSLTFLPCAKSIRWIFPRVLERLEFADFRVLFGRLQVYVPIYPFSEHTCSRDDGVSPGIESCHLTVLSVSASGVHRSPSCE